MDTNKTANKQNAPHKNHGIPKDKLEGKEKKLERDKKAQKQDEPHKKHGLPEDKHEPKNEADSDEEEGFGGLRGGENFRKNLGCGG